MQLQSSIGQMQIWQDWAVSTMLCRIKVLFCPILDFSTLQFFAALTNSFWFLAPILDPWILHLQSFEISKLFLELSCMSPSYVYYIKDKKFLPKNFIPFVKRGRIFDSLQCRSLTCVISLSSANNWSSSIASSPYISAEFQPAQKASHFLTEIGDSCSSDCHEFQSFWTLYLQYLPLL